MTLWIIIRTWIKKYVFIYLFSGTLQYRGEMRLCVIYPIPLSMIQLHEHGVTFKEVWNLDVGNEVDGLHATSIPLNFLRVSQCHLESRGGRLSLARANFITDRTQHHACSCHNNSVLFVVFDCAERAMFLLPV